MLEKRATLSRLETFPMKNLNTEHTKWVTNIHVNRQVPLKLCATTALAQCNMPILLCAWD